MIPLRDDNPTRTFPWVTVSIIGVNLGAFAYEMLLDSQGGLPEFIHANGVIPYQLVGNFSDPDMLLTLMTSMFLHGGFVHLIGNMLYLWIFGNNVEDAVGSLRFMIFYLVSGLVANMTQVAIAPHSFSVIIGASGAIAGILGGYLLLFPHAKVDTLVTLGYFIRIIKLPAVLVLSFWILIQFSSGLASLGTGLTDIAWFAHIGGFVAGVLLVYPIRGRRKRWA